MNFSKKQFTPRNDNVPGYVYLMEAIGYHGVIPGVWLKRCKIGLSRNPELRRQNFVDNQFPCDVRIIKTIYVSDMATIEKQLHRKFDNRNVELEKSSEWFDLYPWQLARATMLMNTYKSGKSIFNKRLIIGLLIALLGVGLAVGSYFKDNQIEQTKIKHGKTN